MTNRKVSSKIKVSFFAMMMAMMAMTMAACGTDEETACQGYDTESSNYEVAADSSYDYDDDSSIDSDNVCNDDEYVNCDDEYDTGANADSSTYDGSVSTGNTVTSYDYDDDYDYDYDDDYDGYYLFGLL